MRKNSSIAGFNWVKKVEEKTDKKNIPASELRQDIVSGDWVVIATGRAKRPVDFVHS